MRPERAPGTVASMETGTPLPIAFQGEHGAFSEMAIRTLCGEGVGTLPRPDLAGAFAAVEAGDAGSAVVPVENSLGGSIDETYEQLMRRSLTIQAEIQIPIQQCLMARPGMGLEDLERVYSHPQALAQCREFLRARPGWELHAVYDTAGAARLVAEAGPKVAAIAPRGAAALYGLEVLREGIQDDPSNTTRFLRVGRAAPERTGKDKTSLVFVLKDVAGALFKALAVFALRELNLRKLQSRPSRERPWHYAFYVDLEGHREDLPVARALAHLEELTTYLKVLGSYPATV